MDDLRILNATVLQPGEDKLVLDVQLKCLKEKLEYLGMSVHDKVGKLIPPTLEIEWLGWRISTTQLTIALTAEKTHEGQALCADLLRRAQRQLPIRAKDVMSCAGFLNFVATVVHT